MNRLSLVALTSLLTLTAWAQAPDTADTPEAETINPASTNTATEPKTISLQEMLVIGPSGLKLHSLAMITQGKFKGEIDEAYLPGFKACAEDPALPVRSVSARVIGQYYIQDNANPNPEAVALLIQLAGDPSPDVQYSAVYYGLSQLETKSDEVLNLLIDIATNNRQQSLYDRIVESLTDEHERLVPILDARLDTDSNVAIYEIYEDLTGTKPADSDKYLEMPSSRPRLFIFKGNGSDPEAMKSELEKAVTAAGVFNPDITISGSGDSFVLLLKTYITKDYIAVEEAFAEDPSFSITQEMWLTPELQVQIDAMQNQ